MSGGASAGTQVLNLLLQVLEDGRLTDGKAAGGFLGGGPWSIFFCAWGKRLPCFQIGDGHQPNSRDLRCLHTDPLKGFPKGWMTTPKTRSLHVWCFFPPMELGLPAAPDVEKVFCSSGTFRP